MSNHFPKAIFVVRVFFVFQLSQLFPEAPATNIFRTEQQGRSGNFVLIAKAWIVPTEIIDPEAGWEKPTPSPQKLRVYNKALLRESNLSMVNKPLTRPILFRGGGKVDQP